jgi:3'-phosphoadenosine 5'-phosphosulfate sulfotransferase (PAPS reductase)/FAD synthetase
MWYKIAKLEMYQLQQRQALELEAKINLTNQRIREWYDYWDGQVYVSFSGGKDSTVLLDLVRKVYSDVPAVFVDTGLEYPEIRDFVKATDNVIWLRPEIPFNKVIDTYGYPVISKEIADNIYRAKRGSQNAIDRMNGLNPDGTESSFKRSNIKYKYLIDAPFLISNKCCNIMKKNPIKKYEKQTKRKPFIGTMACESTYRKTGYLQTGCNAFNKQRPTSQPISFWLEKDVFEYLDKESIKYSKIYDMGYERTGCMFCMFGCQLDKEPNRFQKMKETHPKQYDYCINKLGCGKVLDYIGVDYK